MDLSKMVIPTQLMLDIDEELQRARDKFPGNETNVLALGEEVGELCKACLEEPAFKVRAEAIQVAAMAIRVITEGDAMVDRVRIERNLDFTTPAKD